MMDWTHLGGPKLPRTTELHLPPPLPAGPAILPPTAPLHVRAACSPVGFLSRMAGTASCSALYPRVQHSLEHC